VERLKGKVKSKASAARGTSKKQEDRIERNTEEFKKADTQLQIEIEKRK
jgi:hypothetical protein